MSCLGLSMADVVEELKQIDETKALAVGARGSADDAGWVDSITTWVWGCKLAGGSSVTASPLASFRFPRREACLPSFK